MHWFYSNQPLPSMLALTAFALAPPYPHPAFPTSRPRHLSHVAPHYTNTFHNSHAPPITPAATPTQTPQQHATAQARKCESKRSRKHRRAVARWGARTLEREHARIQHARAPARQGASTLGR